MSKLIRLVAKSSVVILASVMAVGCASTPQKQAYQYWYKAETSETEVDASKKVCYETTGASVTAYSIAKTNFENCMKVKGYVKKTGYK